MRKNKDLVKKILIDYFTQQYSELNNKNIDELFNKIKDIANNTLVFYDKIDLPMKKKEVHTFVVEDEYLNHTIYEIELFNNKYKTIYIISKNKTEKEDF